MVLTNALLTVAIESLEPEFMVRLWYILDLALSFAVTETEITQTAKIKPT